MKLAPDALVEIVDILREGIVGKKDVSQALRELDLIIDADDPSQSLLTVSSAYRAMRDVERNAVPE